MAQLIKSLSQKEYARMHIRDLTAWNKAASLPPSGIGPSVAQQRHLRMNPYWEDFFLAHETSPDRHDFGRSVGPRVDVVATKVAYRFEVELPGIAKGDIDVSVAGGVLTIRGERKPLRLDDGDAVLRMERSYGQFERSFSLPADADQTSIDAQLENGILSVVVTRQPSKSPVSKHIKIDRHEPGRSS